MWDFIELPVTIDKMRDVKLIRISIKKFNSYALTLNGPIPDKVKKVS